MAGADISDNVCGLVSLMLLVSPNLDVFRLTGSIALAGIATYSFWKWHDSLAGGLVAILVWREEVSREQARLYRHLGHPGAIAVLLPYFYGFQMPRFEEVPISSCVAAWLLKWIYARLRRVSILSMRNAADHNQGNSGRLLHVVLA